MVSMVSSANFISDSHKRAINICLTYKRLKKEKEKSKDENPMAKALSYWKKYLGSSY